jgi:hypothetical protein
MVALLLPVGGSIGTTDSRFRVFGGNLSVLADSACPVHASTELPAKLPQCTSRPPIKLLVVPCGAASALLLHRWYHQLAIPEANQSSMQK